MTTEALLREISDYCRRVGMAESTFGRLAVNDGKLVSRLRTGASVTIDTMERVRSFIGAPANAVGRRGKVKVAGEQRGARDRHRQVRQRRRGKVPGRGRQEFPLLRQPAEISLLRQYLQREVGGGAARRAGARQHPSAPARGPRLRCRHRRRHGTDARDARDAQPLSGDAVLYRRQGDQPRGCPAGACRKCRTGSSSIRPRCWC